MDPDPSVDVREVALDGSLGQSKDARSLPVAHPACDREPGPESPAQTALSPRIPCVPPPMPGTPILHFLGHDRRSSYTPRLVPLHIHPSAWKGSSPTLRQSRAVATFLLSVLVRRALCERFGSVRAWAAARLQLRLVRSVCAPRTPPPLRRSRSGSRLFPATRPSGRHCQALLAPGAAI